MEPIENTDAGLDDAGHPSPANAPDEGELPALTGPASQWEAAQEIRRERLAELAEFERNMRAYLAELEEQPASGEAADEDAPRPRPQREAANALSYLRAIEKVRHITNASWWTMNRRVPIRKVLDAVRETALRTPLL